MTKKHFIALADAIKAAPTANHPTEEFSPLQIDYLADFCEAQNPRFDHERWLGYIAGTNGKNGGKSIGASLDYNEVL